MMYAQILGMVFLATQTNLGAQGSGQYLVTAKPIDLGVGRNRFCIAVKPDDAKGVWWWEPGSTGCATRSTGPGLFRPERARLTVESGRIDVRFRIELIRSPGSSGPGYKDIALTIQHGEARELSTGSSVPVLARNDLPAPRPSSGRE